MRNGGFRNVIRAEYSDPMRGFVWADPGRILRGDPGDSVTRRGKNSTRRFPRRYAERSERAGGFSSAFRGVCSEAAAGAFYMRNGGPVMAATSQVRWAKDKESKERAIVRRSDDWLQMLRIEKHLPELHRQRDEAAHRLRELDELIADEEKAAQEIRASIK